MLDNRTYVDDIYIFTKSQPMAMAAFDRFQELGTSFRFTGIRDLDDGTGKDEKASKLIHARKEDGLTILKTNTVTRHEIGLTDDKVNHPKINLPQKIKALVEAGRYVTCNDIRKLAGSWALSARWIRKQDWYPSHQNKNHNSRSSQDLSSGQAGSDPVMDTPIPPGGTSRKGTLVDQGITGFKPTGMSRRNDPLDVCLVPNGKGDSIELRKKKGNPTMVPFPTGYHTESPRTQSTPNGLEKAVSVVVVAGEAVTGASTAGFADGVAEPSHCIKQSTGAGDHSLTPASVDCPSSLSPGGENVLSDGLVIRVTSLHQRALPHNGKGIRFGVQLKGKILDCTGFKNLLSGPYDEDAIFHLVNGYLRTARKNRTVVVIYDPAESWTRCQSIFGMTADTTYKVVKREQVGPCLKLTLRLKGKRRKRRRARSQSEEPPTIAQQVIMPPRHSPTQQFKWTVPIQGNDGTINHGVRIAAGNTRYGQLDAIFWGVQIHRDTIVAIPALPIVTRILEALQADRRRKAKDPMARDGGQLPDRFPPEALALHWAGFHEWTRHGDWWVGIPK